MNPEPIIQPTITNGICPDENILFNHIDGYPGHSRQFGRPRYPNILIAQVAFIIYKIFKTSVGWIGDKLNGNVCATLH